MAIDTIHSLTPESAHHSVMSKLRMEVDDQHQATQWMDPTDTVGRE